MIKLNELLKSIDVLKTTQNKEIKISGISYHSQKVEIGHLFVCIKGEKTDGHKYLAQAVTHGAVAAIVEEIQDTVDIPQYVVKDSRKALAQLGAEFYGQPSKEMQMVGITATNGKTTTSFMTNAIFEKHGLKTGLIGTVIVKIDDTTAVPSQLTTPESLDLQSYLSQMKERDVSNVCMEVSSIALEMSRVEKVDFDIVTFNNISREHIDAHGSFEKYFESKSSLIKNAKEGAVAILNLDCPHVSSLVNQTKAQVVTFGIEKKDGHVVCKNLDLSTGRAKFTVEILKPFTVKGIALEPMAFNVELSVPGYHSVYNSMVAIIIGLVSGIPVATIQEGLKTFKGVERRFEFIFEDDIKIIDDHFANTGNINVTLETLKFMDYNKLHLVYAIRGERGPVVNRENSEAIVNWAADLGLEEIVATKSRSHVTDKDRVTEEELYAFKDVIEKANIKTHLYDELPDAIAHALKNVQPGDLVLLAGCQGMDFGAQIALEQLHKMRPELPKDKLFTPLKSRVAGIS
ncbi:UDP-N-acetylmuramyl-tripeptide synthetase [Serpentinicella sp. ANB-PHB4]|uniref:Mur ligase family protein n=1 Tax=Serpentinicella sp. ANB-PHB4 TaxID=3074076 RepID=UPI00285FD36C|nr:UDP-N-acetylmuramyl-tripeptide synthetase [Serpentinicella sp. ANB-PHB4]MDR5659679.1 UDP-N-acetylmuramyl-tripeptide synthetase [Serpentinicella sp. ANB-PHB4]